MASQSVERLELEHEHTSAGLEDPLVMVLMVAMVDRSTAPKFEIYLA